MGLLLFALIVLLFVLAVITMGCAVARRGVVGCTRLTAAVLGVLAVALTVFLFVEDDYTSDGRSNWTVYDVEYPTIPTVIGLLAGAAWLIRREGSRAVTVGAPLLAVGASFTAFVCFLFTTN